MTIEEYRRKRETVHQVEAAVNRFLRACARYSDEAEMALLIVLAYVGMVILS